MPALAEDNFSRIRGKVDLVLEGDRICTRCHHQRDDPEPMKIGRTRHGTRADPRTPTCSDCHGASPKHIDRPVRYDVPEIHYGTGTETPVAQRNAACLTCHRGGTLMLWDGSRHDLATMACSDCHAIHSDHDPVVEKGNQQVVCYGCHKEKKAAFARMSHHPVGEGMLRCSDCHNVHGSAGARLMKRDTVVDTCYQCHMEKRGPFIWNHQPVTENCALCHEPHGSNVTHLLRWRPPFLCQQCHEPSDHAGIIPAIGPRGRRALSASNLTMLRSCLNCHTAIHGGSNPLNSNGMRLLFQ